MSDPRPDGARSALLFSLMGVSISVATFGFSLAMALRGSDVHLFPVESTSIYRINATSRTGERTPARDRIVVSIRTDFANTAGAEYPDSVVDQSIELNVDGERFACFAEVGPARVIVGAGPPPSATPGAPVAAAAAPCEQGLCITLEDGSRLIVDPNQSTRHSLEPGRITSLNSVFDQRAVTATHYCAQIIEQSGLERPSALAFATRPEGELPEDWVRRVEMIYRARTLQDGTFVANCVMELTTGHLDKFSQDGWGVFECTQASEPVRSEPWWRRLLTRVGLASPA